MNWFVNKDVRPARSGSYLAYKKSNEYAVLHYSTMHHAWNLHDRVDADRDKELEVLYWTFLPEAKELLKDVVD